MQANGIVTFTTDFGNKDPYAGIIKGIVLSANPLAQCVDITHEIAAHDIVNGAFSLVRTCGYFPEGTVHVAVVDPGVGGRRKNIAVKTDRYFFVGPDNGILSQILHNETGIEIREIKNPPLYSRKNFQNISWPRCFRSLRRSFIHGEKFRRYRPGT